MNNKNKLLLFLSTIAPGLFLIGYNIGTGSITTMASAGAAYGMELIWPLLLSCIFTFFLIVAFGKYTIVTGDTYIWSIKKYFGRAIAIFVIISFIFSEIISCMGIMGVVTEVIQEWSRPLTASGNGISPAISGIIFVLLLFYLFWQGQHKFFERILAIFVSLMGLSFLATMFMVIPDAGEVIRGLTPRVPEGVDKMLLMAGMVGTTMGAILYVVRSILVQEKNWKIEDLKLEKRDAFIASSMMFILSIAIMASAAGTLHPLGLKVENAIDMVTLMEPIAGRFAISIFVAGIVSAGLSSLFPIVLLAPWLISDYRNTPRDLKSTPYRLMVAGGLLASLAIPFFGGRPVFIVIISQAMTIIVTPLVLILMFILMNRKELMGKYKATTWWNVLMVFIIAFTFYMAYSGVLGIIGS